MILYTSPFHHALVGALGALITFLMVWGFRFLIALLRTYKKKTESSINDVAVKENDSVEEDNSNEEDNIQISSEYNKKQFCCHCCHQIELGSHYCNYCGFSQDEKWNRKHVVMKKLKSILINVAKVSLGIVLFWCIGLLVTLLMCYITTDVVNGWYYCMPSTIAFVLWFIFMSIKKTEVIKGLNIKVISALTILVLGFWIVTAFNDIKIHKEIEQKQEEIYAKQPNRINRTFYNCSLGDSKNNVIAKLNEQGYDLEYTQSYGKDVIRISEVTYGTYNVERLSFVFIKDELYFVSFTFDGEHWHEIENMLENRYSKFRKGFNEYSDGRTTIKYERISGSEYYILRYYDNGLASEEADKDKF